LRIVILGLSITSSWGNGHATTYRGLVRELSARGHDVLFLERDVTWYADNRDLARPPYCEIELYDGFSDLKERFSDEVRDADLVVVGSYVPEGVRLGAWVTQRARGLTAFYDIDTPVTLDKLAHGDWEYISPELIPRFQLYLSFTAGPTLALLENRYGSPMARALYCSADAALYHPERRRRKWDLGYLGTYSRDRQPTLETLMLEPARRWRKARMVVAGPLYPRGVRWPRNVRRVDHLPPVRHRSFYNAQRFALNITRSDMVRLGWSPSVRLFEAAACATPVISDHWAGLNTIFKPGHEILVSSSPEDTLRFLREIPDDVRAEIGRQARQRVLSEHTAAHRARELETHVLDAAARGGDTARPAGVNAWPMRPAGHPG
jgi:spore maturation protein CgeB